MKNYLCLIIFVFSLGKGIGQSSFQYVFPKESRIVNDISNQKDIHIGVGQNDPCQVAYICAIANDESLKWEISFNNLGYSFFSDVLRINDSIFYAVGEEWLQDDVPVVLSIFLVKMNIQGTILAFNRYDNTHLKINLNGPVNCKIKQDFNSNLVLSIYNQLVYVNDFGEIYNYTHLKNRVIDFKPIRPEEFYYISDSALFHYDSVNQEELITTGFKGLHSLDLYNNRLYFIDNNLKMYHTDLDGQNTIKFSDSIGIDHVLDFEFNSNNQYVLGDDYKGNNQLIIFNEIKNKIDTSISLASIQNVTFQNIDVDENSILIAGYCDYGRPNNFFITLNHSYQLPDIFKDLGISEFKQTAYARVIDTIAGGFLIYDHHFSFEYKITNHGNNPVGNFTVYSDDFFHINCLHVYYHYNYIDALLPGESIVLSGKGDIQQIGSPIISICLKVVAPDNELDKYPENNTTCNTLVSNKDYDYMVSGFQIFPNPAIDILYISKETTGDFKIYNSFGDLVLEHENKGISELNVNGFQPGIYFVKDSSGKHKSHTQKFLKL